jgi:hypothetical protein
MIEGKKGYSQLSRLMMNQDETNCNTYTLKKSERSDSALRHSIFEILRFCGSLLNINPEPMNLYCIYRYNFSC